MMMKIDEERTLKYFTEKQIYVATFLGGPIPAGFLIFRNLRNIGEPDQARRVLMITLVFTITLFIFVSATMGTFVEKIPNYVFSLVITMLVFFLYRSFLKGKIEPNISDKSNVASNWAVAGWTLAGFLATAAILVTMAVLQPAFPGEKVVFGEAGHEVFYERGDFNEEQLQYLVEVLSMTGYYDTKESRAVRIEKRDGIVVLKIPVHKSLWNDPGIIEAVRLINLNLRIHYKKPVATELIHYGWLEDEIKTIRD